MDTDNEIARAKWLLISVTVFLAAGCISWNEVTYLIFGRDATADITKAYEVVSRGRFGTPRRPQVTVEYAFTEPDGTRHTGMNNVSADWPVPANGKVAVRYIPGADGNVRLAGHVHWLGLALFAVSLGAVGGFGYRLWREADEATRRTRPANHARYANLLRS